MARRPNPYQVRNPGYEAITEGVANLGQMFQGQDPTAMATAESQAWQARNSREGVIDTQRARQGQRQLGQLFSNYSPETHDPREVLSASVRSGAYDPDQIGNLFRVMSGNLPGMSEEDRTGALVGTGKTLGPDQAVSMDHQQRIRDENAELELGKVFARQQDGGQGGSQGDQPEGYGLSPGQGRYLDAQDSMREELGLQLQERGVPTDEEGNLRTDLLPEGYYGEVTRQAVDAARRDNFRRDYAAYVSEALRSQDQVPGEYTEDNSWIPGIGEEELRMQNPGQQASDWFRELSSPQGSRQRQPQSDQSGRREAEVYDFRMPDGTTATRQEILETARNRGQTPQQVMQALQARGGQPVVPGA